jgi:hypothetical protein
MAMIDEVCHGTATEMLPHLSMPDTPTISTAKSSR